MKMGVDLYMWDVDILDDIERNFIDDSNIDQIDQKEIDIRQSIIKIEEMIIDRNDISEYIKKEKQNLQKEKRNYSNLVKNGRNTIKIDNLVEGDIIKIKRMSNSLNGKNSSTFINNFGYLFSDIEIIEKTDKNIILKYMGVSDHDSDIKCIEKKMNLNKFKQIYLKLFSNDQIKSMIRDNTISEVLYLDK